MPLDTAQDSLHGASAYTARRARVVTRRILHRMYHQCGNTDTYFSSLSLSLRPPSIGRPSLHPTLRVSVYRHGAIHPPVRDLTAAQSFFASSSSTTSSSISSSSTISQPPPATRIPFLSLFRRPPVRSNSRRPLPPRADLASSNSLDLILQNSLFNLHCRRILVA